MALYYVNPNKQPNGDNEVHTGSCSWKPASAAYLGDYASCQPAVAAAKLTYPNANGCYYCSNACHTS